MTASKKVIDSLLQELFFLFEFENENQFSKEKAYKK